MQTVTPALMQGAEQLRDQARRLEDYRRSLIVVLFLRGYPAAEIAGTLGLSRTAVFFWLRRYRQQGLAALRPTPRKGRPPKITTEYLLALERAISAPPSSLGYSDPRWTLSLLQQHLTKETGQRISLEHLRRLRKRRGRPPEPTNRQDTS